MDGSGGRGWELKLLGYWQLRRNGQVVDVGIRQQRLIAALAILGARSRHFVAGRLWPDRPDVQAAGSLRASVYQVTHQLPRLLGSSNDSLYLDPEVAVDLHQVRRLISDIERTGTGVSPDAVDVLRCAELLPGWYEDWVVFEQERLQQQRLEALETLARHYLFIPDPGRAIAAARAAVTIEPLRESAQLVLFRGHLEAGNRALAVQSYEAFRTRIQRELGVQPSPRFAQLLERNGAETVRDAGR